MRRLLLLLLVLAVLPVAPASPAVADQVTDAARSVAALRDETRRTARALEEGTRRLEAAQRALADVRQAATAARAAADAAQAAEQEARRRLSALVASAYRSPVPDDVVLALTVGPDGLTDALASRADLDRVRGTSSTLLERAESERERAAGLAEQAAALERRQREQAAAVREQVSDLRDEAARAQRRLQAADARLRRARSARARARAACTGGGAGHANGFLPRTALCPIGGGHLLRADAAAAFLRMSRVRRLCVTDSYRSYGGQVAVYRRTPSLAAVPGTSKHGLGIALDLGCGAERFDSETYAWLKANAPRYGWVHPSWAEPGGSTPEPWHWEYVG